jgi:hypothetical protein
MDVEVFSQPGATPSRLKKSARDADNPNVGLFRGGVGESFLGYRSRLKLQDLFDGVRGRVKNIK